MGSIGTNKQRMIGLISGTSVDGIDAVLVDIAGQGFDLTVELVAGETFSYDAWLQDEILAVCAGQPLTIERLAQLDDAIAQAFAQAALQLQTQHSTADLIASHGQTVYHRPAVAASTPASNIKLGYSVQLGRGAAIAHLTGRPTVSNFRAADIAAGGQGAPLVPPVDVALFSHAHHSRCVQNIGGIGNLTYLPAWDRTSQQTPAAVRGWDTGPGNALIDLAVQHFSQGQQRYDAHGQWAATGTPCLPLVDQWLQQDFFHQSPPKSTGRELFGLAYLQQCLTDAEAYQLSAADCLATITELTAASITHSYRQFLPQMPTQVILCGGGSHNHYLRQRLQHHLGDVELLQTDDLGICSDFKEAIAFAVLGFWRYQGTPGNLPTVTGANYPALLGEIYPGTQPQ